MEKIFYLCRICGKIYKRKALEDLNWVCECGSEEFRILTPKELEKNAYENKNRKWEW